MDIRTRNRPAFFYPLMNNRQTPIPRPKDLNLSEEQWKQFDGDVREGVVPYSVIVLIIFATEQIIETEKEDKEQLIRELERIVADRTEDNGDDNQSEHTFEPKYFNNRNDGFRSNESCTQLQTTVKGEANYWINITKSSASTPPHYENGSDGFGASSCGTQLQAATNESGHENHQTIDHTGNENYNEQAYDNRTGDKQNNYRSNNESQREKEPKLQDNGNIQLKETGSSQITLPEQELRNLSISQFKGQLPLIATTSELSQVKLKVVVPKQRMQLTDDHDTRSKAVLPKSVPNKS
ncbi:MAG: hypothetical protein EZS28_023220 [Streblomastix strix]|uniref:Uncharacterized protein n=1 Tax=Streblomastix strix TaxID=222440 RepID=A0A5J4VFA3_9EUKA|nr:MAG: hypothetical protein EZS28_023220 [Streblomastix strix]